MTAITVKGQVTIPKPIRTRLGLRPGDQVEFVEVEGRVELRKAGQGLTPYEAGRELFGRWSSGHADTSARVVRKSLAAEAIEEKHGRRSGR
ncbi:MAG: AbrB/MazE/SpoVT family DNA-binding domain-containing protein [Gemmatimonadota bacterium]